ncbi:MAG TPA: AraC family transcriptional regulator [Ignavibacteriaceae bacterium]|nr:AraC family transcriptional regulator [Ignavibacteriaceae bacterium]
MITKLYIPAYPLNLFIESFFYYTGYNPEHSVDRFLPDGNVQIIFDLTDYPKYIYDNDTLKEIQSVKKVWFSGFRTEPITIPSGKESEMIIVQFHKGKTSPFICEPMHALSNYVVDAELVLKNEILDLREQLVDAETIDQKFSLLENNFLKHYKESLKENPFVNFMVSRILSDSNQKSLKEISGIVGYSQKHSIKIFKDHVGVTPKEFLKIIRFQKAIAEIDQKRNINWASLASDCGFYDQSHFIADFKTFSGFTPVEYVKLKGDFLNYIPIR